MLSHRVVQPSHRLLRAHCFRQAGCYLPEAVSLQPHPRWHWPSSSRKPCTPSRRYLLIGRIHVESGSFDHPRGLRGRQRRGQEDRWPSDRNRLRTLAALVTEPGRKPLTGCCVFRKSLLKSVCMRPCDWMALRHHVFVRGHLQEWTSRDYSERSRQSYHALLCGLYR